MASCLKILNVVGLLVTKLALLTTAIQLLVGRKTYTDADL